MSAKLPTLNLALLLILGLAAVPALAQSDGRQPRDRAHAAPNAACPTNILATGLNGASQVPPTNSVGSGAVRLLVNPATGNIDGQWTISGLTNITAAHIHQGPSGSNGPVVVAFTGVPSSGGAFNTSNTDSTQATNILANPGGFYVNVHTDAFSNGEIRGQLLCEVARLFLPLVIK